MGAIVETGKNFKLLEEEFKRFKSLQTSQKQRGLNDFNVFTTLLSKSDEVRLHSRFISSLLDVNGLHYQGTLFLDLFLQCFKPEGFEFDSSNSHCFREYRNIGLYLTDGTYHIIIENKIYAGDQAKQVERYIETIVKENPGVEENQIWFCYLSIDRQRPSRNSLGVFDLNATKSLLVSNKITTLYSNVHYQTDIPVWLEHCMREVSNLKDLSFSIEQYQSVVAKLNRTYKSKVMNLEEYLSSLNDVRKAEFLSTLISASKELESLKISMMEEFFEQLKSRIYENGLPDGWDVELVGGIKSLSTKWGFPFRAFRKGNPLMVGLEFQGHDFVGLRIGVVRSSNKFDIKAFVKSKVCSKYLADLPFTNLPHASWWLYKKDSKGSLWNRIIDEGQDNVLKECEHEIMLQIKTFMEVCNCSASRN